MGQQATSGGINGPLPDGSAYTTKLYTGARPVAATDERITQAKFPATAFDWGPPSKPYSVSCRSLVMSGFPPPTSGVTASTTFLKCEDAKWEPRAA